MKYKRICILDIETTDRYWNSCGPIQIAAEICDADGNIIDKFNERIRTTHRIAPDASEVHGIYAEDLVNCRREKEVLMDFCAWMKINQVEAVLTYNGEAFDRRVLNRRCDLLDVPYDFFNKDKFPGIDAKEDVKIAIKKDMFGLGQLGRKWKLSLVAAIMGFDNSQAHDALADVEMLRQVWYTLDPIIHPEDWNSK